MKSKLILSVLALFYPLASAFAQAPAAAPDADALAKSLANPVAALISVPFQLNFDSGYANDGWRSTLNIQPVIPIKVNEDWNLIQRVILPMIYQEDIGSPGSESGFGDTVATSFFSPKAPTASGWIWGAGPVFLLPTATNDAFASKKWGVGPSALALKQDGAWTYGVLVNQLWSVAGSDSRPDVSTLFVQPFLTFGAGKGRSYSANFESTYDWKREQWTIPFNVAASQVLKLGNQLASVSVGFRTYLDQPSGGPTWGVRLGVTLLFPK